MIIIWLLTDSGWQEIGRLADYPVCDALREVLSWSGVIIYCAAGVAA